MTGPKPGVIRPAGEADDVDLGQPNYNRAATAIRRDIVRGRLADGERLVTTELARHYGLSLAPIREALHQLAAEGVVVIEPNHGAVARGLTPAFLREIYEIRLGLVSHLEGARAAEATDEDIARIATGAARYEQAVAGGDIAGAIRCNAEFHAAILTIRPNEEARAILRRHHNLILEVRMVSGFSRERLAEVIREHRALVEAFRARSPERAQAVSRLHIQHALDELLEITAPARS